MYAYHFANLSTQFISNALSLVDVDADAFAEDKFHGSRMTQLNHQLHNEVNSLVVWRHSVEVDRVVD